MTGKYIKMCERYTKLSLKVSKQEGVTDDYVKLILLNWELRIAKEKGKIV
tara:strand:+ start:468 stop:617 length:150 start_codon:yes stop_codon:yes gene_type:complete